VAIITGVYLTGLPYAETENTPVRRSMTMWWFQLFKNLEIRDCLFYKYNSNDMILIPTGEAISM